MVSGQGAGAAQVFDTLREEIIGLKLSPGAVLSRLDLQERFRLSSTPVRDALMRLKEEGLVEIFPQHATIVSPIDINRAREGQFLRRSIEMELVRVLASAPDAGLIANLRSVIRQQTAFADLGEHEAFSGADQQFHRLLYVAGGVENLWRLVRKQGGHIDRLRRLHLPVEGKIREILRAHTAIVDAIEAGSPEKAQLAMLEHLSRSLDFVGTLRERYPEYFRG